MYRAFSQFYYINNMIVETYKEMKRTFEDLTGPKSQMWIINTNPLFSIICDIELGNIWGGWRPRKEMICGQIPNILYYNLTEFEAKNFNKEIYDIAINTLLYKAKQEKLKNKLKNIEKDF